LDRGFIGFAGNGNLIISPVAHQPSLEKMGIDTHSTANVGAFHSGAAPVPGVPPGYGVAESGEVGTKLHTAINGCWEPQVG
jgi:hypothetical protein